MSRSNRGFSLVELMVAMTIGLFGVLVITHVYISSEQSKRTTVSGGESQQNGIFALQLIQQDLLMAGYGIVGAGALGCVINATNDGGTTSYTLQLVPAIIQRDNPAPGTDSITIMYSTATGIGGPPAVIRTNHPATAANFMLDNTIGFKQNDFIVAYQPGKPCTLMRTTNDPTLPASKTLVHNAGLSNYNVPGNANFPQSPPHATSGYDAGGLIFNLGQPVNIRYEIRANRLVQVNLSEGGNVATDVAEGIVAIRAQYAIDTIAPNPATMATSSVANGDGTADAHVDPRPDGTPNHPAFGTANQAQIAAGWGRVYAIRVAIVSRSSLREKIPVSPATITLWRDGPLYVVPDRNHRYQVYHTVVPLRNMIWRRPGI